ncbi:helix-turn-helix domain-containing protein [Streptomyces alkaliterrae]|uniref:Helix-turn-helix domain-containing protein n=1 Tax=Streptomyces alkaliterrae TaxID=2213162 RepID=A0A5P0YVZ4_9ACTN|nr:XRE family transcriptional regulator [Streptomyces alkaliterrae]MBB1254245.1 helix-turn-helix transcriptional regulator [Streptomyces alkaliterrae]MBB1260784.1 helix-turn-helix transcriptional regulator [Streptomyces alkaliterrae]MQS02639.1 helix-turn-helix domain-containing protein [Streptomyces alkaliterrae]
MGPEIPDEGGAAPPAVAPRLREFRRRGGFSLEAAARRLGLSPAHLSRLETGQRQPSLPLLLTLARAYGTTVSDLLGERAPERSPVVRAGEPEAVRAGGWTYWRIGGPGRAMQTLRVHLPPGAQQDLVRVHPGEEWLYVLDGRLRLSLGSERHLLDPGDTAHYDSLTPHRLTAVSEGGVELLFVHTLLRSQPDALCLGSGTGDGAVQG